MKGTVPPSITMRDVYSAMWPFVVLQLIGLGLCLAFPALSLWLPKLAGMLD
jgi:TRAP-type mannitol/chloroaromatic compound transport system permease large subunit